MRNGEAKAEKMVNEQMLVIPYRVRGDTVQINRHHPLGPEAADIRPIACKDPEIVPRLLGEP